jgi:DNA replicative helicase MCM subunit Mcm2 (Cdc46/Mcm family)
MPTILSRFDMIFIVKDEHDQQRDMVISVYRVYKEFTVSRNYGNF